VPSGSAPVTDKRHKRMSSMSTRPTSIHQGSNTLPVLPAGMRTTSGASAVSGTSGISGFSGVSAASSMMSARSALPTFAKGDPSSTWEMWDAIRKICNYHPRLSVSKSSAYPLRMLDLAHRSARPHPSLTAFGRRFEPMDRRARQKHLVTRLGVHRQRKGLPRAKQSVSSILARHVQSTQI
jgi:hypothetical protein